MIPDYGFVDLEKTDNIPLVAEEEILRPRHWLARRRLKLAKTLSSSQARAQRYMRILTGFLRGEEDKDFAETAYKCLGKALGFVQEKQEKKG